jgi:hypothetical protein
VVSEEEALDLCERIGGIEMVETTAKDQKRVEKAFKQLVQKVIENGELEERIKV